MNFILAGKTALLGLALMVAYGSQAQTQKVVFLDTPPTTSPKPEDCFTVLSNDSVAFYFDNNYHLIPQACGAIVRYSRVNEHFNFQGPFVDYQTGSNRLLMQGRYSNQVRHGVFEAYYPESGQLHWRGSYQYGQPVGEWSYWYADGKPEKVIRYETDGLKFWQFWDDKGQQLLVNGNGEWWTEAGGSWRGGPVKNGLPDGRWEDRSLFTVARPLFNKSARIQPMQLDKPADLEKLSQKPRHNTLADIRQDIARQNDPEYKADKAEKPNSDLLSYEIFENGKLRKGILVVKPQGAVSPYHGTSHFLPLRPYSRYQDAEVLQLGNGCAPESTPVTEQLTQGHQSSPPFWPEGNKKFIEDVQENIRIRYSKWDAFTPQITLTLDIDKEGKVAQTHVEPLSANHTHVWVNSMNANWIPATLDGKAVGGHVIVSVRRSSISAGGDYSVYMDVKFTTDQP
jgi:hypothetical protein